MLISTSVDQTGSKDVIQLFSSGAMQPVVTLCYIATEAAMLSGCLSHPGCAPSCRLKLLSFLAAAAKATNVLLQRMTNASVEFNSSSLLESLLAAHRCCSVSIESLAALSGSFTMPGIAMLLQVYHTPLRTPDQGTCMGYPGTASSLIEKARDANLPCLSCLAVAWGWPRVPERCW